MVKLYSILGFNTILIGVLLFYFYFNYWHPNTIILGIFIAGSGVLAMILPREKLKSKKKRSELKKLMISPDFKKNLERG